MSLVKRFFFFNDNDGQDKNSIWIKIKMYTAESVVYILHYPSMVRLSLVLIIMDNKKTFNLIYIILNDLDSIQQLHKFTYLDNVKYKQLILLCTFLFLSICCSCLVRIDKVGGFFSSGISFKN
jgi:hypothetical protein